MLTCVEQLQKARVHARQIDSMDRDMKERNLAMLDSITDFQTPPLRS